MDTSMKSYEAEVSSHLVSIALVFVINQFFSFQVYTSLAAILWHLLWFGKIAGYKSQLFSNLKGKVQKVLEIGIGTGPNLKYYAGDADVQVFGVDPNGKMEKYARAAAVAAGLPLANFEFIQAVRMLPLWHYLFPSFL